VKPRNAALHAVAGHAQSSRSAIKPAPVVESRDLPAGEQIPTRGPAVTRRSVVIKLIWFLAVPSTRRFETTPEIGFARSTDV